MQSAAGRRTIFSHDWQSCKAKLEPRNRPSTFTHEIVLGAQQLPLPHRDPADRFLAATAQVMDLTLVTSDDLLLGLGTIRTMKN